MPRKTIRLAQGCYLDDHGVTVLARIGSGKTMKRKRVRFGLVDDDGIPYSRRNNRELVKCYLLMLEDLRIERSESGSEAGTLGSAIDQWLEDHPKAASRKNENATYTLAHWRRSPLALLPVLSLKRSQITAELEAWRAAGVSASECNHRKRALAHVLRIAFGLDDTNDENIILPTDRIARFKEPAPEARGIPMPIVARILASMPDRGQPKNGIRPEYSETKIRLQVMAWTALTRTSLIKLDRTRVRFPEGKLYFPPRGKGKGVSGSWIDILPPAVEALRAFDRAGLWGKTFSRSSMRSCWVRAVDRTRKALEQEAKDSGDHTMLEQFNEAIPAGCKPYDLRHSYLTDFYLQSGDIMATAEVAQHADIKMTKRYTKAAVSARVSLAVDKMRGRWFPEAAKPAPSTVRHFQVIGGKR